MIPKEVNHKALREDLLSLWRRLLHITVVNDDDHFFCLGGDSHTLTQLQDAIHRRWSRYLDLSELYRHARFSTMLQRIAKQPAGQRRNDPVPQATPLTPGQKAFWRVYWKRADRAPHRCAHIYRLEGDLDRNLLDEAINYVLKDQPALRLRFIQKEDDVYQEIRPWAHHRTAFFDVSSLSSTKKKDELSRILQEERLRPFDLNHDMLVRTTLIRKDRRQYFLFLLLHGLAADTWSYHLLIRQILSAYRRLQRGDTLPTPRKPDLNSLRHSLEHKNAQLREDYWRKLFDQPPPPLQLPLDRARPSKLRFNGERFHFPLDATLYNGLESLAKTYNVGIFSMFVMAFQTLLQRYSGQDEMLITAAVNGREAQRESLIAPLGDHLVLRCDFPTHESTAEIARRIQDQIFENLDHAFSSFDGLIETFFPKDSMRLRQVMIAYTPPLPELSSEHPLTVHLDRVDHEPEPFDLSLRIDAGYPEIRCALDYNARMFKPETVHNIAKAFAALLNAMCLRPNLPPKKWNLATAIAPKEDLHTFSGLRMLHEAFRAQAQRTPDKTAIVDGADRLSYGQLDQRSDQLAARLRAAGAGPEHIIGISLQRSADLIVALLGVLKSGAAYAPLPPDYPPARLNLILEDTRARLIVVNRHTRGQWSERNDLHKIDLSQMDIEATSEPPPTLMDLEQLAYVIHTSGSTGRPKGVMVSHRNVKRLFAASQRLFQFGKGDVWLLFHAYAFDFSVWEIWGPLLYGGTLVIAPADVTRSPEALHELMRREGVTVLNQTPSAFRQFARFETAHLELPKLDLRLIIFGGEALDFPSLTPWLERYGEERPQLVNMYGITEITVHATHHIVRWDEARNSIGSLIGRPLHDLAIDLYDVDHQPIPQGAAGEIHVVGDGVARGYLNNPALTAERFVPADQGRRSYKSGDLARQTGDGKLLYLGRIDHQVKIRGYRIELGEIEHQLAQHALTDQVRVLLHGDEDRRRLVAYVTPLRPDQPPTPQELRQFAAETLPDYMRPAYVMIIPEIPLTVHGKLDRSALPEPSHGETPYQPPVDELERELTAQWAQALGIERIGRHDDFFQLGGDSLAATRLIDQLRKHFRIRLPYNLAFIAPTVAKAAPMVAEARLDAIDPGRLLPEVISQPGNRYEPFPLNDIQQAYYFGRTAGFELGGAACRLFLEFAADELDLNRLNRAWNALVKRHDMLRAMFDDQGRQRILQQTPEYTFDGQDLLGKTESDQAEILQNFRETNSHRVLDPHQWPLFHIAAFPLTPTRSQLFLSFDLLILDGFSLVRLFEEWRALYDDEHIELAPIRISFRDYLLTEQTLIESPVHAEAKAYWQTRCASLPGPPELPLKQDPGNIDKPIFARRQARLAAEDWSLLKQRAREQGLTPSAVLCAVYADVLAAWSQDPRFLLNITLFNRRPLHPDVDLLLGDFTTLLPLEVAVEAKTDFATRARRVQEQLWRDLEHRDYSGVAVMRDLAEAKNTGATARLPVVFTSMLEDFARWDWLGDLVYSISQTPQVWLDFVATEHRGDLAYHWDHVADLFPEQLIDAMFDAYHRFLRELADREESWREPAPHFVSTQALTIRSKHNSVRAAPPQDLLHHPFERTAAKTPDAPAVLAPNSTLTYAQLNRLADHYAALIQPHIDEQPNVAVVMIKGWEQAVATLAILKAGGVYVPIAADDPETRIRELIDDAQAPVILTQPDYGDHAFGQTSFIVEPDPATSATTYQPSQAHPDHPAYIIFTSGSTGKPKGVIISHRGALNTCVDINRRFQVTAADRVLGFSALNFDLSVYDLFGVFAAGGALVLPEAKRLMEPAHWAERIQDTGVTLWNTVPAVMGLLVERLSERRQHLNLRLCMLSGDWIPVALPDQIREWTNAQVISLGGATEASIWSNFFPVTHVESTWRSIPYGYPLTNQWFHVLDEQLRHRPDWAAGDLYIGGMGLALGYWRDPEKTKAAFILHPQTGERLYRTGDRGYYRPDGVIIFLGRLDHQVKIRGRRIELGEIESALEKHPKVVRAAVIPVGHDDMGAAGLAAYVSLHTADTGDTQTDLTQPAAKVAFKLQRHDLRRDVPTTPALQLEPPPNAALDRRRSIRHYLDQPVSLDQFKSLLRFLGEQHQDTGPIPRRAYGSAGSLYPVQIFVVVKPERVTDLQQGIYYLHPQRHALYAVADVAIMERAMPEDSQELWRGAAFAVLMVAHMPAIEPLYGEESWPYALIEAGLISQLLETEAKAHQLGLCQIGGISEDHLREPLGLTTDDRYCHALIGGVAPPEAWGQEDPLEQPEAALDAVHMLKQHLSQTLPAYMMPSTFTVLPKLPLTDNGKIDRKQLPDPQQVIEHIPTPPKDDLEETILEVLREALEISDLDVTTNYFEAGGGSLRVIRAHGRLEQTLQRSIPITDLFQTPTVRALADRFRQAPQTKAGSGKARAEARKRRIRRR